MAKRRHSQEIEHLVEGLNRRLTEAVESAILTRARFLTKEHLRAPAAPQRRPGPRVLAAPEPPAPMDENEARVVEPSTNAPPTPQRSKRVRPSGQRPAAVADANALPTIDPEEQRRAAELARLRSILRPTAPEPTASPVTAPMPASAAEEKGSLNAFEDHIGDQLPALAGLSQSRCTARIAAWVGRVRLNQSGPNGDRTRIASRILLDKLRNLAWSMDAGTIEGLDISWSTRNWERVHPRQRAHCCYARRSPDGQLTPRVVLVTLFPMIATRLTKPANHAARSGNSANPRSAPEGHHRLKAVGSGGRLKAPGPRLAG